MARNQLENFRNELADGLPRSSVEAVACQLKVSNLAAWRQLITTLRSVHEAEFQGIIACFLYAGFTAGELARASRYDTSTVIRWAEGATAPRAEDTRAEIRDDCLALLDRRIENWAGAQEAIADQMEESAIAAQKEDWRSQRRPASTPASLPRVDREAAREATKHLLSQLGLQQQTHPN